MKFKASLFVWWLAVATAIAAETPSTVATLPSNSVETPVRVGLGLAVDLRPSWTTGKGSTGTENELAGGYTFSPNAFAGYVQEFRTNLFTTTQTPLGDGTGFRLWDGYFKGDFQDLWVSRGKNFAFGYEPRLYLPTMSDERLNGFVAGTRQYLKLSYRPSPDYEFNLWEVPVAYAYLYNGYEGPEGPLANKTVENRLELQYRGWFFNRKLVVKVPLILQNIRYREFGDAKNSDRWCHQLWVYPEVIYSVSPTTGVGFSYYSENLVRDDFALSDDSMAHGMRNGVVQLILQQTI